MRLYKFSKEKPTMITDKFIIVLRYTVLCSLIFAFVNKYILDAAIAHIFLKGSLFYLSIILMINIYYIYLIIEEMISAKKNGIDLIIFWNTRDVVKKFKGCSIESLLNKYDGYYDYEGENIICIYNQFRFKLLIDANHTIKEVLSGHNVSELGWVEKRIRMLRIQKAKNQ